VCLCGSVRFIVTAAVDVVSSCLYVSIAHD
jgi:hypothetical protein